MKDFKINFDELNARMQELISSAAKTATEVSEQFKDKAADLSEQLKDKAADFGKRVNVNDICLNAIESVLNTMATKEAVEKFEDHLLRLVEARKSELEDEQTAKVKEILEDAARKGVNIRKLLEEIDLAQHQDF